MLCRVLIAAVAVTCTLSCIHAHGQGAKRLDRIKDVMCVLLLSGMQKEDLDVSMLMKLQHHNVNFNDMNNEELLHECIQTRHNNIKAINITDTQHPNGFINAKSVSLSNLDTIRDALYKVSVTNKNVNVFKANDNKAILKKADENKSNANGQPKLESVFKFWQDMKINKAIKTTEPTDHLASVGIWPEQESKRSVTENLQTNEADTINKFLANFLLKERRKNIDVTTTPRTENFDGMYDILNSMRLKDMTKISNVNIDFENKFPLLQSYPNIRKIIPTEVENMENKSETKRNQQNLLNQGDITALMHLLNTFNNPFKDKNTESYNLNKNPYLNSFRRPVKVDTTTNREPRQAISRETIKEIAQSVKEIILRDLRKEMHETTTFRNTITTIISTTASLSTTKTESTVQTTLRKENIKAQDSVMSKFLELFEEIKSLKQNTITVTSQIDNKNTKMYPQPIASYRTPIAMLPPKYPLIHNEQFYGVKQYPAPNLENIFDFVPQLHKFRSNKTIIKVEPNKGLHPITVQTNNIEIPPLGIPLDEPQNLINQNIVVTTITPYRINTYKNVRKERGNQHTNYDTNKLFEAYKLKQTHPRLSNEPYKDPTYYLHSNYKDDIIRYTQNNNGRSKYNTEYYEKVNLGKYKSHSDSRAYEHRYQQIPRFHEKLENGMRVLGFSEQDDFIDKIDCCNDKYGYSKAMVDCCNRKVASRQQMSLNNIKKNSYDDTHYKNFLKSQQKVTDMLERILADKGNIQSVETA